MNINESEKMIENNFINSIDKAYDMAKLFLNIYINTMNVDQKRLDIGMNEKLYSKITTSNL